MNKIAPPIEDGRPTVVSFGGGKGGAGRTTLCAEVARALARQNQRVLCVDASFSCPTLHIFLHAEEPPPPHWRDPHLGEENAHVADVIQDVPHKQLWYLSLASARRSPYFPVELEPELLIAQLHQLDFDWVFLDLPPEIDPQALELFVLSDIPILVGTPEPAAVRMMTQYLRAALFQSLPYHPLAEELRQELLELLHQLPIDFNSRALEAALGGQHNKQLLRVLQSTTRALEPYLVVNLVREGAERDLGHVIAHALFEEIGIFPRVLTSVDFEDRRWFYNRRIGDGTHTRADEALSSDIERLARSIVEIDAFDALYPRPVVDDEEAHPARRLGINPEAGANQLRQHCRRLWEGYRREAVVSLVFSESDRRQKMAEKLERLYRRVLTTPTEQFLTMRAEELDTTPFPPGSSNMIAPAEQEDHHESSQPENDAPSGPPRRLDQALSTPGAGTTSPPMLASDGSSLEALLEADAKKIAADGGALIRDLRRRHGLSLRELSSRTHIGVNHLAAIESADIHELPRDVYLRGYLREIARIFDVDSDQLIDRYFQHLQ